MLLSPQSFMTYSLAKNQLGLKIAKVLAASINSVEPSNSVFKYVSLEGEYCVVGDKKYCLRNFDNIYVVGAGKAGEPMASAISTILGKFLSRGIVIVKEGYISKTSVINHPRLSIIEAGHPFPDERGVQGTRKIIKLLETAQENDLVFCLVSGGGSALLTSPMPDIQLSDLQELMNVLLRCGANIDEINSVRKHLDAIKGGRLSQIAAPSRVISLILSDVLGDPLETIASGPTVPDKSTYRDAISVIDRYGIKDQIPKRILKYLIRGLDGEVAETPKPGDKIFKDNQTVLIGSNKTAAKSAIIEAQEEGFNTLLLTTYLKGEARHAGEFLASIAKQLRSENPLVSLPACIVIGGETTVKIMGEGIGGRNQELALGAAADFRGLPNTTLVALATDGEDGPTDAAGAVVTGKSLDRALDLHMDHMDYLNRNDSYTYFSALNDLIKTGSTRTNVNDLTFIFSI